jgi:hypothetical protein
MKRISAVLALLLVAFMGAPAQAANSIPNAPTNFTITKMDSGASAKFTWKLPKAKAGVKISYYMVSWTDGSSASATSTSSGTATSLLANYMLNCGPKMTLTFKLTAVSTSGYTSSPVTVKKLWTCK